MTSFGLIMGFVYAYLVENIIRHAIDNDFRLLEFP